MGDDSSWTDLGAHYSSKYASLSTSQPDETAAAHAKPRRSLPSQELLDKPVIIPGIMKSRGELKRPRDESRSAAASLSSDAAPPAAAGAKGSHEMEEKEISDRAEIRGINERGEAKRAKTGHHGTKSLDTAPNGGLDTNHAADAKEKVQAIRRKGGGADNSLPTSEPSLKEGPRDVAVKKKKPRSNANIQRPECESEAKGQVKAVGHDKAVAKAEAEAEGGGGVGVIKVEQGVAWDRTKPKPNKRNKFKNASSIDSSTPSAPPSSAPNSALAPATAIPTSKKSTGMPTNVPAVKPSKDLAVKQPQGLNPPKQPQDRPPNPLNPPNPPKQPQGRLKSSLIDKMEAKLQGGRFRSLNEALYTQTGSEALSMMSQDPELFQRYHEGFHQQTLSWPKQPIDVAVKWIKSLPIDHVVADFGCGEAALSQSVKQKVHSFDLVSNRPEVVACNMSQVPLLDSSVDVAVFSLALMGTDYSSFLIEARRVLKANGWLWIAEVRSRFGNGGAEEGEGKTKGEDFKPFLGCLKRLGFKLVAQDASDRMFVVWTLRKGGEGEVGCVKWPRLKACQYKRR